MGVRPGTPKPPGSGRKRGSIDREQRKLLTDKMAADIMKVYKRLGPDWLFEVAKERPDLFLNQCLSRMFPAPIKEDPDVQINTQFNMGNDPTEVARRIAFALSLGLDAQDKPIVEHDSVPYSQLAREDLDPREACHVEAPDPEREQWAREVVQTPEERLASES